MLWCKEYRTLFLRVPRTGTLFIKAVLWKNAIQTHRGALAMKKGTNRNHAFLGHLSRLNYNNLFDEGMTPKIRHVFAFVRHPLSYYQSVWSFCSSESSRQMTQDTYRCDPFLTPIKYYDPDFNVWVERMLDNEKNWVTRLFEQYVGPEGGEFCDKVGRLETIREDLTEMFRMAGIPDERDAINKLSPKNSAKVYTHAKPIWDERIKMRTAHNERVAIRRFYGDDVYGP